ncbi:MAG: Fe-S cluster protein [Synergistaceae bacterium]|jgi:Na+-translocating ferredoxin:NAD+ oxidoreductase RNF subunit RnfB|nr:Fe-S cluster protein [Synergistaceae bacterium]
MAHSIKISYSACHGCVNCIKSCPTEAIRVIAGSITIIKDICIDCGECLRACERKALGLDDDDWDLIRAHGSVDAVPDPTFFSQFGSFWHPYNAKTALAENGINLIVDDLEDAFDLSAFATARLIDGMSQDQLPLISVYCPSVVRLIQLEYPELLTRLIPVDNPIDIAAEMWRQRTKSFAPLTLFSPCPAKITMVRDPVARQPSSIQHTVSVKKVVHTLMASGVKVSSDSSKDSSDSRFFATWAMRGGESRHIAKMAKRDLTVIAVSGLRNTMDLLEQLELGRLRGVDFVECRTCDLGCFGGVAVPESRFLAHLKYRNITTNVNVTPEREEEIALIYEKEKLWKRAEPIPSRQRLPLSNDLGEAMSRLKQMKAIFAELPHIDCGACGRPSCKAMAEDVAREQGGITDCIFKLREDIASLAGQIISLADLPPNTLKRIQPTKNIKVNAQRG